MIRFLGYLLLAYGLVQGWCAVLAAGLDCPSCVPWQVYAVLSGIGVLCGVKTLRVAYDLES